MGLTDKLNNKKDDLTGKAHEAKGHVTGDTSTENKGKAEQAKATVKQAGEKVKDAAGDVRDAIKK